jgi:spore germination protein GerM
MRRPFSLVLGTVGVVATLLVVAVACGVPSEGEFVPIEADEIPYGLAETTTTVPPTTTQPTTTVPESTSTTVAQTTTTIAVEEVSLYFLTGTQAVAIQRALASPASPSQVFAALAEGPPSGEAGVGLRTALPDNAEAIVTASRGVVTVDLPSGFFDEVPAADQRLAVAQIVLTLSLLPRSSLVVFTEAGEAIPVPRGGGDLTEPGEPVTFEDYEQLLVARPPD